jgi:hypothetical protein
MRFMLLIYLLLGTGMSAMIIDTPSVKLGFNEAAILAGIHLPFIGFGVLLALSSKPTENGYRYRWSPGAWGIALVASYAGGFVGFLIAK